MSVVQSLLSQADTFQGPEIQWWSLSPLLVLVGGALLLMLAGALTPKWPNGLYALAAVVVFAVAGGLAGMLWWDITQDGAETLVAGAVAFDAFSMATVAILTQIGLLVALIAHDYLKGTPNDGPEIYALLLVAVAGGTVMASANDLIVLFLGLETFSLALYVLAAMDRTRRGSQEAGMKYFVLGGFSSAFFLYGIALVYGATGSTNIGEMVESMQTGVDVEAGDALALAGVALMLVGLGFKIAAVPFHSWAPDVYQGAPTPMTAFMASAGKIAAIMAILRVLVIALPFYKDDWRPALWVLAVLTLLGGSILAVVQTDVKRMLAYSSIAHAGFLLVGVVTAGRGAGELDPGAGMPEIFVYVYLYDILVIGSFAVVYLVERSSGGDTDLDAFDGLSRRRPLLALGFTVLLLAQAGIPFTSGFVAKFAVISAAVSEEFYVLSVIAMVAAVIAAFLYLRIMIRMWLTDASDESKIPIPFATGFVVALTVLGSLFYGLDPEPLLDAADSVLEFAR